MLKRFFAGGAVFLLGVLGLTTPFFASASGNCTQFCANATPRADGSRYIVIIPGSLCNPTMGAAECRSLPPCPSGTVVASPSMVREFCSGDHSMFSADEQTASGWCNEYPDRFEGGICYNPVSNDTPGPRPTGEPTPLDLGPQVSANPIPQPAHPGDAFRCRFMCSGDTQARDGGSCTAMTDLTTCYRQCVTACGGSNSVPGGCIGVNNGGTLAPQGGVENQVPLCIPTQGATASVAGITDTQRYETINESFSTISIPNFIGGVVRAMLGVAGALFFGLLVWAGLQWMTAGGSQDQVHAAQKTLYNAAIGIAIIALSYTLVSVLIGIIANFAGVRA